MQPSLTRNPPSAPKTASTPALSLSPAPSADSSDLSQSNLSQSTTPRPGRRRWQPSSWSKERRLATFLCVNLVFMGVEFGYGWFNGSLGMLSDAAHMLLDNVAIAIGLAAATVAARCTSPAERLYADRYCFSDRRTQCQRNYNSIECCLVAGSGCLKHCVNKAMAAAGDSTSGCPF